MKIFSNSIITILLAVLVVLQCKHENYPFPTVQISLLEVPQVQVNSVGSLVQRSADNYNDNRNGIISGTTLTQWIEDWRTNRPPGISGKLVILQIAGGTLNGSYIRPDHDRGLYVYGIANAGSEFGETRSNGVISTVDMVLTGAKLEALLAKYGINPSVDLVVFAPDGTGSVSNLMQAGRAWYNFRYWGVSSGHLAILNGGVNTEIGSVYRGTTQSPLNQGSPYRLGQARIDNTILQATLGDVIGYVKGEIRYSGGNVRIVDARSSTEFNADRTIDWSFGAIRYTPSATHTADNPQSIGFEGHIKGAHNLVHTSLLDITGSGATQAAKFKSPAELRSLYAPFYQEGDLVITYCRTNVRAMITGIASMAILGYPTRFYDGSWIEWGSLVGDRTKRNSIDPTSPWRTDTAELTGALSHNFDHPPNGEVTRVQQLQINNLEAYRPDTNKSIQEDKQYIQGSGGSGGGGGGGGSRPGNPCG